MSNEKDELLQKHEGEEIFYTTCPLDGCFSSAVCLLKIHKKDGVVTAITPDDTVNKGIAREDSDFENIKTGMIQQRPCPRGYSLLKEIYSPNRLLYPMKRVGERGEGKFERISWDEALDTVADKMKYVKEKYGPYSIWFGLTFDNSTGFPLAPWFGAGLYGWGSVSFGGSDAADKFWLGYDIVDMFKGQPKGLSGHDAPDLLNSKLIIMWGWNPVHGTVMNAPYYLTLAREKGIPIIDIDCRYTRNAENLADQWIPIRPGTDLAMMQAMAYVLFDEDLYDKEFVSQWVEPEGFQKFRAHIMGEDDGEPKTPAWAEKICGVPEETIVALTRLYAKSKPAHLHCHWAIGKNARGEYAAAMAIILQAMTGNTMRPGGCSGGISVGSVPHIPVPTIDWQKAPHEFVPHMINTYCWADAILLRDDYDSGKITKEEYDMAIGNESGGPAPNIQMVVFETNSAFTLPDANKRIKALKKIEFVLSLTSFKDNPTSQYADILLPYPFLQGFESLDSWELTLDMVMNRFIQDMANLPNKVIYQGKVIDPPGETRPKIWIWTQIAKRLGIADKYQPRLKDVPLEEWDDAIEAIHKEAYEKWAASEPVKSLLEENYPKIPTWEEFKAKPIIRVPIKEPYYPFKYPLEFAPEQTPFKTPSGKIEFYSNIIANEDPKKWGGKYDPIPKWKPSYMPDPPKDGFFSSQAKDYPLFMVSPVCMYHAHSFLDNNPLLRNDIYRHGVWMSVPDAKARGLKDGDLVRVRNERGEAILPVYVTSRMVPGSAAIHHSVWYERDPKIKTETMPDGVDRRGEPNFFTGTDYGPHGKFSLMTSALIQVEKFEEEV